METKKVFGNDNIKNEVIREIKQRYKTRFGSGNSHLKLPRDISFISKEHIHIFKEGCLSNMQEDSATFEGWAWILRYWLNNSQVILSWDIPDHKTDKLFLHYNRFLYRVLNFKQIYSWFKVSENNELELNKVSLLYKGQNDYFLNTPSLARSNAKDNKNKDFFKLSESDIERQFLLEENKSDFKEKSSLSNLDNQFPVGVFKDKVNTHNRFFTAGKSAIDLWGLNKEKDQFNLFELKKPNNRKIGLLSELFFYSFVINDLRRGFIKVDNPIISDSCNQLASYSNAISALSGKKIKTIKAHALCMDIHPLLNNELFSQMTIELSNKAEYPLEFNLLKYNNNFKVTK